LPGPDGGRVTLNRVAAPASSVPSFAGIHAGERPPRADTPLRHKPRDHDRQRAPQPRQTPSHRDSQRQATYIDAGSPFNYWSALNDATSVKDGKLRLQVLINDLEHAGYQSAARCLADDLDALVAHLRYPLRHRERWRSTNLLERSLGEVRRRTKVMGRFPGETSCLSLVWAVLDLFFSHASNGATFTDLDRQHLYRIKYPPAEPTTIDEEVTAA